jgi:hypothetical protein
VGTGRSATCAAACLASALTAACAGGLTRFPAPGGSHTTVSEQEAIEQGAAFPAETAMQPALIEIWHSTPDVETRLTSADVNASAELVWDESDATATGRSANRDFDVHLKRGASLFGMRRFRVRATDDALAEARVASALRRGGVLVPRQVEVRVSINEGPATRRTVEERFSKELAESQQRRDGVMFRFSADAFPEIRIDAYRKNRIRKSEARAAQLENAEGLLAGYLDERFKAHEVFDLDLLARFLAVAEVWNSASLLEGRNLRFYFNPITQRIEPIGYRGRPGPAVPATARVTESAPWAARLLEDGALRRRFAEEMATHALEIAGANRASPARLARARALAVSEVPAAGKAARRIWASADMRKLDLNPIPSATLEQALSGHPFLEWVEASGVLRGAPGVWRVEGSLVLPDGVGLELSAGTVLRFASGEMLLATGPLLFSGTADAPVVLEADPSRGTSWQGIAALRSNQPHSWEHVVVRDTTGIDRNNGWVLTGGVTLRGASVRVAATRLEGSGAEDALNLIRSDFAFVDLVIDGAASDAFDCDFCTGTIRGGRIENVGGDGIDISGSEVMMNGVRLVGIRDKALSVGEKSKLNAHNLEIGKVGTAAASKDASDLSLSDSSVTDVGHVALMAYQKKQEYGPARLRSSNVQLNRVARVAVVQHGSRLEIDGRELVTEIVDTEQLYENGPMKK